MSKLKDRIFLVRNSKKISMEKFGESILISKSAISSFEKGKTNPSNQTLKLISEVYSVDYDWLKTGIDRNGNPSDEPVFMNDKEKQIEQLKKTFNLDEDQLVILTTYLELSDTDKTAVTKYIRSVAENLKAKKKTDP